MSGSGARTIPVTGAKRSLRRALRYKRSLRLAPFHNPLILKCLLSNSCAALGYAACQDGHSVLLANAIDVINNLHAGQTRGTLKTELRR